MIIFICLKDYVWTLLQVMKTSTYRPRLKGVYNSTSKRAIISNKPWKTRTSTSGSSSLLFVWCLLIYNQFIAFYFSSIISASKTHIISGFNSKSHHQNHQSTLIQNTQGSTILDIVIFSNETIPWNNNLKSLAHPHYS